MRFGDATGRVTNVVDCGGLDYSVIEMNEELCPIALRKGKENRSGRDASFSGTGNAGASREASGRVVPALPGLSRMKHKGTETRFLRRERKHEG